MELVLKMCISTFSCSFRVGRLPVVGCGTVQVSLKHMLPAVLPIAGNTP